MIKAYATVVSAIVALAGGCAISSAGELAVKTIAGTGAPENNGDAGDARSTNIGHPFGVEIGPDGGLYITEVANHRVRRLDLKTGHVTTVAGCGRQGYSGDGGPATAAELNEPYEVRFDADGNMYFVEMQNHLVRRADHKTKVITTVAGTGRPGFGGDGGPATKALLRQPHSIALDKKGNLYVADIGNHRIRRIDRLSGIIESIAGNAERKLPQHGQAARGNPMLGPRALCIADDHLWIALREGHSVWRLNLTDGILHHMAGAGDPGYSGDGGPAIQARFNGPKGIAVGPRGQVYVVDTENDAIRAIDLESDQVSTIVGSGQPVRDGARKLRDAAPDALHGPHGVCIGPDGAIYVGDTLNHRVQRVR